MSLGIPETGFVADELDSRRSMPVLSGSLPPECRKDVESLGRFIRECIDRGSLAGPVFPDAFREVLLTGATGFIGRFFLRELLRQNPGLRVYCVVRANDVAHGL